MGKRVVVVGAGAVGGYSGGRMALGGANVTLIDPWPEHVQYIRNNGLQLSGLTPAERQTVKVNAMHISDVQSLSKQKPVDIAFICTKSYDTEWAALLIRPYLAPDGFIVSLQNCINEERIAPHVGWGRVIGCVASLIAVDLYKAGHIKRTVPIGGKEHLVFRVGEPHGRVTRRAQEVAELMRLVDSAQVTTNLWGERWSKLVINAMRNGLSAVTGMAGNARDTNPVTRWVGIRLGSQAVRVGQAMGFELVKTSGMEMETLARAGEGFQDALTEITDFLDEFSRHRSDEQLPSMGQDILKGRRTETDFINGFVAAKGDDIGVPAPLHALMNELVKKVERGEIKADPAHVAAL